MSQQISHQQMKKVLIRYFSKSELTSLCFDLGIPDEDLDNSTLTALAQSLTKYADRHNLFDKLVATVQAERPHASWESSGPAAAAGSASAPIPTGDSQPQASSGPTYVFHGPVTGAAIGGGKVRAENIAGRDIVIGQPPQNLELFEEQLQALKQLLAEAIAADAISSERDAETIVADVEDVIAEVESTEPRGNRIKRRLEDVGDVLETTAKTVTKAGKAGKAIWQALPLVKQLIDAVALIF